MNLLKRIGVWIGGAGLLAAVTLDTLAVIGRNIGMPIVGSIELMRIRSSPSTASKACTTSSKSWPL